MKIKVKARIELAEEDFEKIIESAERMYQAHARAIRSQQMKTIQIPDHLADIIPPEFDEKYEYAFGKPVEWRESSYEMWHGLHGEWYYTDKVEAAIYRRIKKKDRGNMTEFEALTLAHIAMAARISEIVCNHGRYEPLRMADQYAEAMKKINSMIEERSECQ